MNGIHLEEMPPVPLVTPPLHFSPNEVPVGTVVAFAGKVSDSISSPPRDYVSNIRAMGWMECDGSSLKVGDYPELFAVLGYLYGGSGDTFNLPDYRGYFFRGVAVNETQDPGLAEPPEDEDKRQNAKGGTKNGVGSTQQFSVEMHEHRYINYPGQKPKVESQKVGKAGTVKKEKEKTSKLFVDDKKRKGKETRPKNIYVHYIIKIAYLNPNIYNVMDNNQKTGEDF